MVKEPKTENKDILRTENSSLSKLQQSYSTKNPSVQFPFPFIH